MTRILFLLIAVLICTACRAEEMTFRGEGDVTLSATLQLPQGQGPWPALLLLPGSGPTDRDGNQGERRTDLLKQLADHLASQGIASLRFDKRGIGADRGALASMPGDKLKDYVRFSHFIADSVAAFRALLAHPAVDPKHCGILGHSEGGILAIEASRQLAPAALVLIATPGRRLDLVLRDQVAASLQRQAGLAEQQRQDLLQAFDHAVEELRLRDALPAEMPSGIAPLFPAYLTHFWHEAMLIDPSADLAAYDGPVLLLQGDQDKQVSVTADAPILAAALSRRHQDRHQLLLLQGIGHLPEDATEGPLPHPLAAGLIAALDPWLRDDLMR
jgi:dienelactone hydrolase